jgi:hypothetical protein
MILLDKFYIELMDRFKNQISSFVIDITKDEKHNTRNDVLELTFTRIFSMFKFRSVFKLLSNS